MTNALQHAFQAKFDPAQAKANTFQNDNDILLFLHIPKTAGMSVGKALKEAFDEYRPIAWENTNKSFRQQTRAALYERSYRTCRQVLMGHFAWADVQVWRNQELPVQCATIIRDPVARLVSNYNYNGSEKHPPHAAFKERFPTLESYALALPLDYQLHTMIGMFFDFDHALEQLSKYYSFIGVTEHLGASLEHLRVSHGLQANLPEHRENTGLIPAPDEVPETVRDIVLSKSRNDTRLHDLIKGFYS